MPYDEEKQLGEPAISSAAASKSLQRPLTAEEKFAQSTVDVESRSPSSEQEYQGTIIRQDNGILSKLRSWESAMDRKLGIESEAIDRKLPDERQPMTWASQLGMALLWASGTMNLSCFSTGFLGWQFGLSLKQSILIVIFASLLGGAVSAFSATLGAATGLRQISISRYSMGWWPNKVVAALNVIQQLGWSAAGCITGGIALVAASDGSIPIAVGVIIIAIVSLVVSFAGLKMILIYERYAWAIYLVIFLIIFGQTGRYADNSPTDLAGADLSGQVLSLIAVVYGSSASWCTIASDYYVSYPVNVSRVKVFFFTTLGISIPTSIGMVAGCVVSSALNNRPDWNDIYENQGLGFLLQEALYPYGFAKFLLVLLVLSGINCNIINTYSAAISCQQFARPFARMPRFVWTILCFGVIVALSLAGRKQLQAYLENFLSMLGYWCTSYFVILFCEHYIFRKGNFANYDLEGWNDPKRLPVGVAAFCAFALGVVMWIMGLVQTWYVGPVGARIGSSGGDVANELTLAVTAIAYVPFRYLELKYIGR
ncbi:hypothetical protein KC367_g2545 [Hortaea werneckii]|nr:hypothetical protein KC361_g3027 [Hortaea werneckii]KAI6842254.1 hypothetical protein KC342_g1800 [Hortaea werneckii]KAI6886120.1 hypothetical protein KC325_g3061 [Hortaea werneckii]KAI6995809.1 hypothetical protein KC359_g3878 [Hortaea werneckii]KAI7105675.1 hypothetical protein KC339_g3627 [Hortaea werneckii]